MNASIAVPISESSQAGEARRVALALAHRLGFKDLAWGKVGIVVTEAANNLLQHAHGGILVLRAIARPAAVGIEILALDRGPGMVDVATCLQDGYSTAGTAGNGLGAMRRLSSLFEIYSLPKSGTALLAQLWAEPSAPPAKPALDIGTVCLPKRGEEISGDAWASQVEHHRQLLLVADGLGHGPAAAKAAAAAISTFQSQPQRSPDEIIKAAHLALRGTRGAALAIAEIDLQQQSVHFAGIGNIAANILTFDAHHHLLSHNGTVGHEIRKIQQFTYPWYVNGLLIMHSDGLSSQWQLNRYPGLSQNHPSLIAGVLYRDFHRERDDVTVLVVKEAGGIG